MCVSPASTVSLPFVFRLHQLLTSILLLEITVALA